MQGVYRKPLHVSRGWRYVCIWCDCLCVTLYVIYSIVIIIFIIIMIFLIMHITTITIICYLHLSNNPSP